MKIRFPISALAIIMLNGPASADSLKDAKLSLEMWNPQSVEISEGTLTVILRERRITPAIFNSVIATGICLGVLLGRELPEIREIVVLNRFSYQGFEYEAGTQHCEEINNSPAKKANILVAMRAHAATGSTPTDP